jgi:hypothetical protein
MLAGLFCWCESDGTPRIYQVEPSGSHSCFRTNRAAIGSGGAFAQVVLASVAHLRTNELDLERLKMVAYEAAKQSDSQPPQADVLPGRMDASPGRSFERSQRLVPLPHRCGHLVLLLGHREVVRRAQRVRGGQRPRSLTEPRCRRNLASPPTSSILAFVPRTA